MKKLFKREVVPNRVEILTNKSGVIKFVMARRRDDLNDTCDDTHWQLLNGKKILGISAYRSDLECHLKDIGYVITHFAPITIQTVV